MDIKMKQKLLCSVQKIFMIMSISLLFFSFTVQTEAAVKNGFYTSNGATYYYKNGKMVTGWLTLKGNTYYFYNGSGKMATGWVVAPTGEKRYFYKNTGIMATGWVQNSTGEKRYFYKDTGFMATGWVTDDTGKKRYFYQDTGFMATGWVKNSVGAYRYFSKATGYMYTGLRKVGNYYYFFSNKTGAREQNGFMNVSGSTYYFTKKNGRAKTGWLSLSGKKYYFDSKGVMYVNRTAKINGKYYTFDKNGIAAEGKYEIVGNNVKVTENGRSYYLMKEFLTHPGIANNQVSDLDLLAALCECEAGGQGLIGMEAVALTVLNRTIKPDKEFPSTLRYVIYEGKSFAQYSPVTDGSLLRRLNGNFSNKALAKKAAKKAMEVFDDYVKNGTKRKIKGFPTKDFNYWYFMMPYAFWNQNLAFDKVNYYIYKSKTGGSHVFFVDWISP